MRASATLLFLSAMAAAAWARISPAPIRGSIRKIAGRSKPRTNMCSKALCYARAMAASTSTNPVRMRAAMPPSAKMRPNTARRSKTFNPFNTALSPIEWRIANGVPFAAIERWSISDSEGNRAGTWLVVTALRDGQSCHVHYVAGSYPDANEQARRAADDLARGFDCENDVPTSDSKIGAAADRDDRLPRAGTATSTCSPSPLWGGGVGVR